MFPGGLIEYPRIPCRHGPRKARNYSVSAVPKPESGVTRLQRTLRVLGALGLCIAAGSLFAWLKTPIPWMIGPLLAFGLCAACKCRGHQHGGYGFVKVHVRSPLKA